MKNKLLHIFFTILLLVIIFIFNYLYLLNNINISLKYIALFGIFVNLFCIFSFWNIEKKIISPYMLFIVISLPFLYGMVICTEILGTSESIYLVSTTNLSKACFLIMFCQVGMHLGVLSYYLKNQHISRDKLDDKQENNIILMALIITGWILLAISIVPTLNNIYEDFKIASQLGYQGVYTNVSYGMNSIGDKLTNFFVISLFMLMVGYKNKKPISFIVLIFCILFFGMQMFLGNRGIPLLTVIMSICVYHLCVKKFNYKTLILFMILSIPLLSLLVTIKDMRQYGLEEWINNIDELLISNITTQNPILEVIGEIGGTINPIGFTIGVIPENEEYRYGMSYIYSILSPVIINSSIGNYDLIYNMNIAQQIGNTYGYAFGGSYIQEIYANFGNLSVVFAFILGVLFAIFNIRFNKEYDRKNYIFIIFSTYFMIELLWTIRNTMSALPRIICWYILFSYLLYYVIRNTLKKEVKFDE